MEEKGEVREGRERRKVKFHDKRGNGQITGSSPFSSHTKDCKGQPFTRKPDLPGLVVVLATVGHASSYSKTLPQGTSGHINVASLTLWRGMK